MSVTQFLKNFAVRGMGVMVAATVIVAAAQAEIGPQPPRQPQKNNNVSKALTKFFKKSDKDAPDVEGAEEESGDNAVEALQSEDPADKDADKDKAPAKAARKAKVTEPTPEEAAAKMAPPKRPPMLSQPPLTNAKIEAPQVDSENPPVINHPKLDDPNNPLGLTDAQNRLQRLSALVTANRYAEAKPALQQLRQWLVDITEAHIGLYKTLNQIPSARGQAELEKELALQFAQLRDQAMMESARISIAEKDYSRAVKDLTEVVKSQPRSKVGLHSYELLQEIGFTEKLQLTQ